MSYSDVHRFLLRSVASRGVMSLAETQTALNSFSGDTLESSVQDLVREINVEIRPFQQTLKITNDELTKEKVIIFLSLGYDDATKAQGVFTATELEYFRILIEQVMTTESRQITSIHAMNLVGQMKSSFTKTDAQKLLNLWCKMRYLDKDDNNYGLGVRAIHEFESYLRQNMPDFIEECILCKQIVFRIEGVQHLLTECERYRHKRDLMVRRLKLNRLDGYNCPGCVKAVHTVCLNKYLETVKKWPCCRADFNPSQLRELNGEMQSLNLSGETEQFTENNTAAPNTALEPTVLIEDTEAVAMTQDIIPEISQRITRKRKRL